MLAAFHNESASFVSFQNFNLFSSEAYAGAKNLMFKDSTKKLVQLPPNTDHFVYLGPTYITILNSLKKGIVNMSRSNTQIHFQNRSDKHIYWQQPLAFGSISLHLSSEYPKHSVQCLEMVCCGQQWGHQVWQLERRRKQRPRDCLHQSPLIWRVPEKDYGKTVLGETCKSVTTNVFALFCAICFSFLYSALPKSSRSAKRLMLWQSMEGRCTQLESVAWFLLWWSSMTKVQT